MEKDKARQIMSALAQETRFRIFEALVAAGDEGVAAGRLASFTGSAPNTITAHMAIMSAAGLVSSRKDGQRVIYAASPGTLDELVDLLSKVTGHHT